MAIRQMFTSQLIELWGYLIRRFSRRVQINTPTVYLAYSIGPDVFATGVYELEASDDEDALHKSAAFFHDGLKRIEVWCGSRKVGDIPPEQADGSDEGTVRDSA